MIKDDEEPQGWDKHSETDFTDLLKAVEVVIGTFFELDERPVAVLTFALPPDYKQAYYVTNVDLRAAAGVLIETMEKIKGQLQEDGIFEGRDPLPGRH